MELSMSTQMDNVKATAIQALLDAGFELDGETQRQTVRIPTKNSPILGRSGGELVTSGGRIRLMKPNTNIKATVGGRTICLYRISERKNGVSSIANVNTKDLEGLNKALFSLNN
jgi:hypothetical protein